MRLVFVGQNGIAVGTLFVTNFGAGFRCGEEYSTMAKLATTYNESDSESFMAEGFLMAEGFRSSSAEETSEESLASRP